MGVEYKTSIKKLTADNTGTNYVELLNGTGNEFVTNFFVSAATILQRANEIRQAIENPS